MMSLFEDRMVYAGTVYFQAKTVFARGRGKKSPRLKNSADLSDVCQTGQAVPISACWMTSKKKDTNVFAH